MIKHYKFLAIWIIGNALGWLFGPLSRLAILASSLQDVVRVLPIYLWQGLLLGVVIGAGQALAIRMVGGKAVRWFSATVIGYTLAFPAGLAVLTAIQLFVFHAPGTDCLAPRARCFFNPFPAAIFLGYFFVGLAQWLVLRPLLPRKDWQTAALWVFGLWASFGLSFFVGHWSGTITLGVMPERAIELIGYRVLTGATIGALSGALMTILLAGTRRTLPRRSSY